VSVVSILCPIECADDASHSALSPQSLLYAQRPTPPPHTSSCLLGSSSCCLYVLLSCCLLVLYNVSSPCCLIHCLVSLSRTISSRPMFLAVCVSIPPRCPHRRTTVHLAVPIYSANISFLNHVLILEHALQHNQCQ
jgi:hypothetical protein